MPKWHYEIKGGKTLNDRENEETLKTTLFLQKLLYDQQINNFVGFISDEAYVVKHLSCKQKLACCTKFPINLTMFDGSNTLLIYCRFNEIVLPQQKTLVYCDFKKPTSAFWQWCKNLAQCGHLIVIKDIKPHINHRVALKTKGVTLYILEACSEQNN